MKFDIGEFCENQESAVLVKIGLQYVNTTLRTAYVSAHISNVTYKIRIQAKNVPGL
jgi:hypothetical protein